MLKSPVTSAVISIISRTLRLPYFSSVSGPSISIRVKFPVKCDKSACPAIWVNNLRYVSGLRGELRYTINSFWVIIPPLKYPRISEISDIAANVRITGELYEIRNLLFNDIVKPPLLNLYIKAAYEFLIKSG